MLRCRIMTVCEYVPHSMIPSLVNEFIFQVKKAEPLIIKQPGYISHRLIQNQVAPNRFILLVEWDTITSHTEGFRKSEDYVLWKHLLHHFYEPFPTVSYYTVV
ncbi:antibiotic biosynthesis monooxygenase [bacterium]|nr:antibiotic biosynthesis monooxygenase [bacterium]